MVPILVGQQKKPSTNKCRRLFSFPFLPSQIFLTLGLQNENLQMIKSTYSIVCWIIVLLTFIQCSSSENPPIQIQKEDRIALIGNNLCARMMHFGHFETEMQLQYPDHQLFIRNLCDGGDTPGFRAHSGRSSPWAFPNAEKFYDELANPSGSQGHFETPDEWLTRLKANIIVAFFGYNESFAGAEGLANFKDELRAFIDYTLSQEYNGTSIPQLVLVSPIAFQNLSDKFDLPNGEKENKNLLLYTDAMKTIAQEKGIPFLDAFSTSKKWFARGDQLTVDGSQLNDKAYQHFSKLLVKEIFGNKNTSNQHRNIVAEAVKEKNWLWYNDYKIPNGVHVYGRRYEPFGPDNYPDELKKIREMTAIRDEAIWAAANGEKMNIQKADDETTTLSPVSTNYKTETGKNPEYLYGENAIGTFKVAPGYKLELFASEKEFPDLANPVQLSFDNKGRLWVATMPSYPHYQPGDEKPNDKLIILEDTDNDGKADKQSIFADGLHLPLGFEIAHNGVYVAQSTNLIMLKDTDGDGKADSREILLSGFDNHDSHHGISAFCSDPSGAIYMSEGVFLHTNVETSYGTVRATNGGFYRYAPQRRHLERTAQLAIPNPWGIAFDDWGQNFFLETSGPDFRWMMPGSVKPVYGVATHKSYSLIEEDHRVRPTSGVEFISSRHFPEEVQGDFLLNNTIGFLGTKQHSLKDDGTGYSSKFQQDLLKSSDSNFRPVDLEFAPDGSLYIVDWHNVLVGHMQHNARDPLRDHSHGRIYRVTYPARPLVEPANIAGASIEQLLDNLKLPEYRTRYRTRRELRGHSADKVLPILKKWVKNLNKKEANYNQYLVEALWVTWGLNQVDETLLEQVLNSDDFRARTAAVRVLRYTGHQIKNQQELLMKAAQDEAGRVRLEALVAASWLEKEDALEIINTAGKAPMDKWIEPAYQAALAHVKGNPVEKEKVASVETHLKGRDLELFKKGKEIYNRDGYCVTCHQGDGKGLEASSFPPLTGTSWVIGNENRLIKLILKGLMGPLEIQGKKYPGQVPMTPYGGLLNDEEVAAVVNYIRNDFGNRASTIRPDQVNVIRKAIEDKEGFYTTEELLKEHPMTELVN